MRAEAGVAAAAGQVLHRSGAVARMLNMPVATLRVWERRYRLTQTSLSSSGRRLYTADDVKRLTMIKQLSDQGHAIGTLAPLDMQQLQQVAATQVQALVARRERPPAPAPVPAWRLAVVGTALAARLQHPALLRQLGRPVRLLGPFDNPAQAAKALQVTELDAVLIHVPQLQPDWLKSFDAAAPALSGLPKLVLYGFAAEAVCEALATSGAALLREPQPDVVLAQWLQHQALAAEPPPAADRAAVPALPAPLRRWDDAALTAFASRASAVACECPRHVAELLLQLAHFETYSADCLNRNAPDAALHAYLRQLATAARVDFESALEHVALHEGLKLP